MTRYNIIELKPTCFIKIKDIKITDEEYTQLVMDNTYDERRLYDLTTFKAGIRAVKKCSRFPNPPLCWFRSGYSFISSNEGDIKEWIRGRKKTFCQRDLITDHLCVAGYEADFVVYLGSKNDLPAYMSRCRGQFVHIE